MVRSYSPVQLQDCKCDKVMSLFADLASLVVADFMSFPHSEFGVLFEISNAKSLAQRRFKSMRCVVAPRWHISCLAAAPLAVACFRHRVEWYRIQTTKMCGHRWFLLIGIQPPHIHGEDQHCLPPTSSKVPLFHRFASWQSIVLRAKYLLISLHPSPLRSNTQASLSTESYFVPI